MAAAPVPLVLIKWTYVLVLLLSFSCLNSSFPCLDPAYHSKVSLERDTFKTFYCGLWTHAHVFDFKPSWAKYFSRRGNNAFFSRRGNNAGSTEECPRKKGAPLLRGQQYRAAPQFSFFIPYSIHAGGVGKFSHFWLEKEHCICKITPFLSFSGFGLACSLHAELSSVYQVRRISPTHFCSEETGVTVSEGNCS